MRVTVRLFARLHDITGSAELARDVARGATIAFQARKMKSTPASPVVNTFGRLCSRSGAAIA